MEVRAEGQIAADTISNKRQLWPISFQVEHVSKRIHDNFSRIHEIYGPMNHILSFGVDTLWRSDAAREIVSYRPGRILDVATGTGDLAMSIWKEALRAGVSTKIVGIDFNSSMLEVARERIKRHRMDGITVRQMDALKLGYDRGSFDLVTSGFAIRNFDDVDAFLKGAGRVLCPGGKLVLLDMAMPDGGVQRAVFGLYAPVMRMVGRLVDKEAYDWLVDSIEQFDKKKFVSRIRGAGFKDVRMRQLASGIAYIVTASR